MNKYSNTVVNIVSRVSTQYIGTIFQHKILLSTNISIVAQNGSKLVLIKAFNMGEWTESVRECVCTSYCLYSEEKKMTLNHSVY